MSQNTPEEIEKRANILAPDRKKEPPRNPLYGFPVRVDDFIITPGRSNQNGGQQVTTSDSSIRVELPGMITISCGIHRSQLKNKNLAIALIELALDDR